MISSLSPSNLFLDEYGWESIVPILDRVQSKVRQEQSRRRRIKRRDILWVLWSSNRDIHLASIVIGISPSVSISRILLLHYARWEAYPNDVF